MKISPRLRALVLHDLVTFAGAFAATGVLTRGPLTRDALVAAAVAAAKVTLRSVLPVPAKQ